MKRFSLVFFLLIVAISLTSCANNNADTTDAQNNDSIIVESSSDSSEFDPTITPTEEYIINCLKSTPNIRAIAPVTEDNDPNGKLNSDGGYYSAVFFSVDLFDTENLENDALLEKGTDVGGCIEAYQSVIDAETRNNYLKEFDDNWLFNSGYHTIIGTLVIRTSKELTEDEHKLLEQNIIASLLGQVPGDPVPAREQKPNASDSSENHSFSKITMPNSASSYIGSEWTLETLTEHLKELGFTNIKSIPCSPSDDNYRNNIMELYIQTGWISTDPWVAGEEYDTDAEISIYYNERPLLTIDNCPDLLDILSSRETEYMDFATKYDGYYIEFDGYVAGHTTHTGGTDHIIDVAWGEYREDGALGYVLRAGDRTWGNSIDKSVEKGDSVLVSGRIDASWSEYYHRLYVECLILRKQ